MKISARNNIHLEMKNMNSEVLYTIMNPKSIAYFGASNSMSTLGTAQLLSILNGGYAGRIYPIHPREKQILGLKAYRKIVDLDEVPDLAILAVSNKSIPTVLKECGQKGLRSAIVISAGYSEMGVEGEIRQRELLQMARAYGVRMLGPNCIGVLNTRRSLNTTWFPYEGEPGHVGIISQSGTYVTQMFEYFNRHGIRLSQAISVGNQADLDIVDCLYYLAGDPETKSIAVYIEGLKEPRSFLDAAFHITRYKPIVALFVGGTEQGSRAGFSHTGAITGPDSLYEALFRQSGVLRSSSVEELFDWTLALAQQPLPQGRRVAVLTNSGGPGASMANECELCGLVLPEFDTRMRNRIASLTPSIASLRNPVDITMSYDFDLIYRKIPSLILQSDAFDALLFYGIFGPEQFLTKAVSAAILSGKKDISFFEEMKERLPDVTSEFGTYSQRFGKPILCTNFFGRDDEAVRLVQDAGIPVYPSPERAVRALAALCSYSHIKRSRAS